jgi:ppGpp synthetase/RelA/SpoT-type nucleotidyltranferase
VELEVALTEYEAHHALMQAQGAAMLRTIEGWLSSSSLKLHSINLRIKSREAFEGKLARPDRTYSSFWDITDIIGIRIVTYFEDTIDLIAKTVEQRLHIDFTHSTDKRRMHEATAFGYRSLHYVCGFGIHRLAALPESARFEIQIRTLLQHTWAEIEHDLGYKTSEAVPVAVRRRFSRIASLLEIADQEFVGVRQEIEDYAAKLPKRIEEGGEVLLDQLSLASLLEQQDVRELDQALAKSLGRPLNEDAFFPDYLVRMLKLSGIKRVSEALSQLVANKARILALVEPYFTFASSEWKLSPAQMPSLFRGYSLFFLAHMVLLDGPLLGISKVEQLARFYGELDYPDDPRTAQRVAGDLLAAFQSVR